MYDQHIAKWNGRKIEQYGGELLEVVGNWYNKAMRKFTIVSKTHGTHEVIVDDDDHQKIEELGGKWYIVKKRASYYAQKHIDGKAVELHRWIMGKPDGMYVDHISRDTLDNRKSNLRIVSNADNLRNGNIRVNNKSGAKGVWYDKARSKWAAEILVNYKKVYLGRFTKFEDAVKARNAATERYWKT